MRSILIGSAAAILAISTASPAFAQYGGSPDDQVETAAPGEEGVDPEDAYPDEDVDMSLPSEDQGAFEDEGPPPEDGAYRDDSDLDVDLDADIDQDVDVDQDGADPGQTWQGEDGRSYCRRSDGTTGLIVGGGAGALVGRGIDSHGRRGTGTIIGAIAGALVGTAIERSANEQRCR
jgi:hypothetical protein